MGRNIWKKIYNFCDCLLCLLLPWKSQMEIIIHLWLRRKTLLQRERKIQSFSSSMEPLDALVMLSWVALISTALYIPFSFFIHWKILNTWLILGPCVFFCNFCRSFVKRSLSDGNILCESKTPMSNANGGKKTILDSVHGLSSNITESTPEISTCGSDITYSR